MPRRRDRIDNYGGTQTEYVAYLEEEVRRLRRPAQLPTPPPEREWLSWNPQQGFDEAERAPLKWPDRVKPFFEAVPRDEEQWQSKRRALGLSNADEILNTYADLTSCGNEESADSSLTESESTLVGFGRRVGTLIRRAERLHKLSHFCSLIFVAACCVALENGQPVQFVDEALREFFKAMRGTECTAGAKTLARYRRSALWIVKRMDELYPSLGHRAFELFLHGGATVTMFEPLIGDPRMPEAFRKRIATSEPIEEEHASLPLSPTLLVWFSFSHTWRFSTICKALQTSLFSEEEAQKYLQTYRARKLHVCRFPKESHSEVQSSAGRLRKRKRASEGGASAPHEAPESTVEGSLGRSLAGVSLSNGITAQLGPSVPGFEQRRFERTGISSIDSLLNRDGNTPPAALATAQGLLQDSEDSIEPVSGVAGQQSFDKAAACDTQTEVNPDSVLVPQHSDAAPEGVATSFLRAIEFKKQTLQQIVFERPADILGGIWFGSLRGYPPFVSLRLQKSLGNIVKPSGQVVYVPEPSLGVSSTVTGTYLIKLECFKQMIQRDGFGTVFWNECGEEAFVTMLVMDERLAADFIRGAVLD